MEHNAHNGGRGFSRWRQKAAARRGVGEARRRARRQGRDGEVFNLRGALVLLFPESIRAVAEFWEQVSGCLLGDPRGRFRKRAENGGGGRDGHRHSQNFPVREHGRRKEHGAVERRDSGRDVQKARYGFQAAVETVEFAR